MGDRSAEIDAYDLLGRPIAPVASVNKYEQILKDSETTTRPSRKTSKYFSDSENPLHVAKFRFLLRTSLLSRDNYAPRFLDLRAVHVYYNKVGQPY